MPVFLCEATLDHLNSPVVATSFAVFVEQVSPQCPESLVRVAMSARNLWRLPEPSAKRTMFPLPSPAGHRSVNALVLVLHRLPLSSMTPQKAAISGTLEVRVWPDYPSAQSWEARLVVCGTAVDLYSTVRAGAMLLVQGRSHNVARIRIPLLVTTSYSQAQS